MGVHHQRERFLLEGPLVFGFAANNERHIQKHALAPSMYLFYLRTFDISFEHPAVLPSKTSWRSVRRRDPRRRTAVARRAIRLEIATR